ncbi:MCP four helix bundle domain-containing protein [Pelomonas sp. V22]|uniref:MCP four helix bundle domain-containing protein n=1 Tax=Pelomonas sp. V22 TaxID=2822139 RepID=UPI0024A7B34C|nr:MCP four helix bundle domain-containing protein [Pelomonas sp. V22]MDI4635580.1 MCP four helix bundle domain-containing protein [Pelomonas sp. V22]
MTRVKPSKLRRRLLVLTGLVLLLMAGMGVLTLSQLRSVSMSVDSLYKDRLLPLEQLRRVALTFNTEVPAIVGQLRDGRLSLPLARQQLDKSEQAARRSWNDYLQTYLVDAEKRLIQRAEPELQRSHAAIARLRLLLQQGRTDSLTPAFSSELRADAEALLATLGELSDVQLQIGRREAEDSEASFRHAVLWVTLMVALTTGLGLLLTWSVLQSHQEEQGAAEASQARLQRFYMALSQTNQLIVRNPESAQQLFEALCRICVETGHAKLAKVVLKIDGDQFERAACFGPIERLMPGAPKRWNAVAPHAQAALSSIAINTGLHAVSNRAIADGRLTDGNSVIPPGVEAMAAFPLRRQGEVVGALSLLAGELDFFDEAMLALLDEMAGDVSFALDNLDREQTLRDSLQKSQQERALFQLLFNASAVSAALVRLADGTLLEINEQLCRHYGYSRAELLGRRPGDLGVGMVEADRNRLYGAIRTEGRVRNMQIQLRGRDGSQRRLLISGDLIDYQGEPCALATAIDITELQQQQQNQQ